MQVVKSRKNFFFNRGKGRPYKDEIKTYSGFSRERDPFAELHFWPTLSNVPYSGQVHVPVADPVAVEDQYYAYRWYKIRLPNQGVGVHERLGNSIYLRSIYLKGYFEIKPRLQRPVRVKLLMMHCKNRYSDPSFEIGELHEFEGLPEFPVQSEVLDSPAGSKNLNDFMAQAYYMAVLDPSAADTCRIKKVWEATLYPQEFKASAIMGMSFGVSQPVSGTTSTSVNMLATNSTSYQKFSTNIKINRHYNEDDYGLYFMFMVDSCLTVNEGAWNDNVVAPGASTVVKYSDGVDSLVTTRADRTGFALRFISKAYYSDS